LLRRKSARSNIALSRNRPSNCLIIECPVSGIESHAWNDRDQRKAAGRRVIAWPESIWSGLRRLKKKWRLAERIYETRAITE
jgi:hypothetical protein